MNFSYTTLVSCIQSSLAKVGDVGQDLVGGLGPDKRFGVFIGDVQVAVDGSLKFGSALMHAAAQLLFGEQTEPALHQVQPRAGGCEVQRGRLANQFRISAVLWVA